MAIVMTSPLQHRIHETIKQICKTHWLPVHHHFISFLEVLDGFTWFNSFFLEAKMVARGNDLSGAACFDGSYLAVLACRSPGEGSTISVPVES